jgi:tRNA uridine 5-carboxymethylaminomethyl modification enzyme
MAASRMGARVGLVTMDPTTIGRLSCNPSIGGSAKGHLAKEIDALGGVMARIADASGIQFKMLNTSKGPAVWSPRSQNDKDLYPLFAQHLVASRNNITVIREQVVGVQIENNTIIGVTTANNEHIRAETVVLCGGTFLNGVMWTGETSTAGGRVGESAANGVSDALSSYGLVKGRLKTGTPPRIHRSSIDYTQTQPHNGDEHPVPFSISTPSVRNQLACFATNTTANTHDILRDGFSRSPMFTGRIQGAGPRYCPSIEDKIDRFAERDSHVVVLEPEGLSTDTVYVNGFSTSLPFDIQDAGLRSIPALEHAEVLRYGYAVEYDFFYPYQLHHSMETKAIKNLFFAGQINGTSGYEEAASQGLIAGINAAQRVRGEGAFTLTRSESYIGVLIDDLVNKNTEEPYRIFTSLAEYRLLLRIDTAYRRLSGYGRAFGLIDDRMWGIVERKMSLSESLGVQVTNEKITPLTLNSYLEGIGEDPVHETTTIHTITRRPKVSLKDILRVSTIDDGCVVYEHPDVIHGIETEIKYEGYITKLHRDIERFQDQERMSIPQGFDYEGVNSLSTEARQKLQQIQPSSLGQASRIPGVSASDVSILALYLR